MAALMQDTIAAIATAPGQGGIAIVRISGPEARAILQSAFRPARPRKAYTPNMLMYGHVVDGNGADMDECMAVFMAKNASYTREDVAEIHSHGGSASAMAVLERVCGLGARPAQPGEFTKRAFLNGRIDLAEAEAVMSVIGAKGQAALRAGVRQLEGGVSAFVRDICDRILSLLAGIEAATDFPEEIDEEEAAGDVLGGIASILTELDKRLDERGARILREGASVVLSGRPNVGKSSLMNALLNRERAIVTDIPGTTRDVLTERIQLGGVWAELSDTAGLRDAEDPIERIGVQRAEAAVARADVVLYVLDAAEPIVQADREALAGADERWLACVNKTDAGGRTDAAAVAALRPGMEILEISARTGEGIDGLISALSRRVGAEEMGEEMLVSRRHIDLAKRARQALQAGADAVRGGIPVDMAAGELRRALEILCQITGRDAREDVIDQVFREFCVGK